MTQSWCYQRLSSLYLAISKARVVNEIVVPRAHLYFLALHTRDVHDMLAGYGSINCQFITQRKTKTNARYQLMFCSSLSKLLWTNLILVFCSRDPTIACATMENREISRKLIFWRNKMFWAWAGQSWVAGGFSWIEVMIMIAAGQAARSKIWCQPSWRDNGHALIQFRRTFFVRLIYGFM